MKKQSVKEVEINKGIAANICEVIGILQSVLGIGFIAFGFLFKNNPISSNEEFSNKIYGRSVAMVDNSIYIYYGIGMLVSGLILVVLYEIFSVVKANATINQIANWDKTSES